MMATVTVVNAEELDYGPFVELQKAAFAKIIENNEIAYLFSEDLYRWKYNPPAGSARIAILKNENGIASACSMYPLNVDRGGGIAAGWQFCDIATHPRGQKKGYFSQCLDALREHQRPGDIYFVFPNHNSKQGFKQGGFSHVSDLRTMVSMTPMKRINRFVKIEMIETFDSRLNEFFKELAAKGLVMINRSSAYMNWRYNQHPLHRYESFLWRDSGRILGIIVLRRMNIRGLDLAVSLELLALNSEVERGLLLFAAAWGREMGVTHTLSINNSVSISTGILSAYLTIPIWFLPKHQQLLISTNDANTSMASQEPWNIQIGDWDGF